MTTTNTYATTAGPTPGSRPDRPGWGAPPGPDGPAGRPRGREGARARTRAWAATTPGGLRLASVALVLLVLVSAVVAAVAVSSRQSATRTFGTATEPLLVEVQGIYTSLSDADTTVAGGFLFGGVAPTAVQTRYQTDIAQATANLASAAQHTGASPVASSAIGVLAGDLPAYTGLIETARANNRQGFPVGAAYLGEASNLMRTAILPAATSLLQFERQRLGADRHTATNWTLPIVAAVALAAVLVTLLWVQRRLARRFRRTLNPALAGATVLVVGLIVWLGLALSAQGSHVQQAEQQGAAPIATLTQARLLASQARADDELTLVTRDAVPSYQDDYTTVAGELKAVLATAGTTGSATADQALRDAATSFATYEKLHSTMRASDSAGNLNAAIALDSETGASDVPAVAGHLDAVLASAIDSTQAHFSTLAAAADGDLTGLIWGIAALGLLIVALILAGVQPRINEYR